MHVGFHLGLKVVIAFGQIVTDFSDRFDQSLFQTVNYCFYFTDISQLTYQKA